MTGDYLLVIIDRKFWEERLAAMYGSATQAEQAAFLRLAGQPLQGWATRQLTPEKMRQKIADCLATMPDAALGALAQQLVITKEDHHECSCCCQSHA